MHDNRLFGGRVDRRLISAPLDVESCCTTEQFTVERLRGSLSNVFFTLPIQRVAQRESRWLKARIGGIGARGSTCAARAALGSAHAAGLAPGPGMGSVSLTAAAGPVCLTDRRISKGV